MNVCLLLRVDIVTVSPFKMAADTLTWSDALTPLLHFTRGELGVTFASMKMELVFFWGVFLREEALNYFKSFTKLVIYVLPEL